MFGTAIRTWVTAGAGTVAALLVAGLLGAFAALPKPPAPDLPAGEPIEAGQWWITPVRAYLVSDDVYGVPLRPGQRAIVLEADLANRTAESSKDYFDAIRLVDQVGEDGDKPLVALTRDSILSPDLHPAMPERMAYVWALAPDGKPQQRLSFAVSAKTYKARDNLYGAPGWFNPEDVGTFTLALDDASGAARP
jgi:hypothetical protein